MMDNKDNPLWSDGKTGEEIECLGDFYPESVILNLYEDILCLKQDRAERDELLKTHSIVPNEPTEKMEKTFKRYAMLVYKPASDRLDRLRNRFPNFYGAMLEAAKESE